jgi:hypothetical protein
MRKHIVAALLMASALAAAVGLAATPAPAQATSFNATNLKMSPAPPILNGDWAPLNRCPVADPSMLAADGNSIIAVCNTSDSPSGSIKLGNSTATTGDSNLQFGLLYSSAANTFSFVSPPGGAILAAPVPVPGGLTGLMCPSSIPVVSTLCNEAIGPLNDVTATVQPAGNPSNFNFNAGVGTGQPILTLPVKIQLQNPLLGSSCYIGTDSNPIVLHPENTTAPQITAEYFDPNGTPDPNGTMFSFVLTANQSDSTFSVPGANGCGPGGVADVAIDLKEGLPSPSGNNYLVLNNATTYFDAGFVNPGAQYPNEGQDLAAAWNSAVQP